MYHSRHSRKKSLLHLTRKSTTRRKTGSRAILTQWLGRLGDVALQAAERRSALVDNTSRSRGVSWECRGHRRGGSDDINSGSSWVFQWRRRRQRRRGRGGRKELLIGFFFGNEKLTFVKGLSSTGRNVNETSLLIESSSSWVFLLEHQHSCLNTIFWFGKNRCTDAANALEIFSHLSAPAQ